MPLRHDTTPSTSSATFSVVLPRVLNSLLLITATPKQWLPLKTTQAADDCYRLLGPLDHSLLICSQMPASGGLAMLLLPSFALPIFHNVCSVRTENGTFGGRLGGVLAHHTAVLPPYPQPAASLYNMGFLDHTPFPATVCIFLAAYSHLPYTPTKTLWLAGLHWGRMWLT